MHHRSRLAILVAQILAGCGGDLDDEACLNVVLGEACPAEEEARDQLVGTNTCESPVREVVSTGALVSESDVIYTGYGGFSPYESGDTGFGPNTRCCYEARYRVHPNQSCTIGRPLVVDGEAVSAEGVARADWSRRPRPDVAPSEALAEAWIRDGLLEHASVAAFARVALELTALGAPPELLARTAAAMADEVRHAEDCFAIASAFAGREVGPGPLPAPAMRPATLERLAVETLEEGCVGETLAVARAARQLRDATDPVVRAVLARIVRDEARHAELAWDIVRWAIAAGGPEVRQAVAARAAALQVDDPAFTEVIVPTVAELLAA